MQPSTQSNTGNSKNLIEVRARCCNAESVRRGLPLLLSQCGHVVEQRLRAECIGCGTPTPLVLCGTCQEASGFRWPPGLREQRGTGPLGAVFSCGYYRQRPSERSREPLSPLAVALRRFKYDGDRYTGRRLARLLGRFASRADLAGDLVVPVPLHRTRLVERGFNQSGLLAAEIARASKVPIAPSCLRRGQTSPTQRGLGRTARRRNMEQTFSCEPLGAARRRVVLVDDVMTTGATALDAARALRGAGASSVVLVVLLLTEA